MRRPKPLIIVGMLAMLVGLAVVAVLAEGYKTKSILRSVSLVDAYLPRYINTGRGG